MTGNIAGWSVEEWAQASQAERDDARVRATAELTAAGTHLVIDSVADLPAAIADIEQWLAVGEAPG
jgi:phosphonoacetaldehyde hydrolase